MITSIHLLGISGSLRAKSFNSALLRAIAADLPDGFTMEIYDLNPLPMFHPDIEAQGVPDVIVEFLNKIHAADALLISTPEYNHSISGALKNAIDWASRRHPELGVSVLSDKTVGMMSVAPGSFGGVHAQGHLHDILTSCGMHVINRPSVIVANAHDKFGDDLNLIDETTRNFVNQQLEQLHQWTLRLKS